MRKPLITLVAVATVLAASPVAAHKLKVFATAIGTRIEGRAYFVGGGPARHAPLSIETPDGIRMMETETDKEGAFALTATMRVDHVIVVDSGDGHTARFTIAAGELPDTLPRPAGGSAPARAAPARTAPVADAGGTVPPAVLREVVGETVAQHLAPLREQIDALEDRVLFRDVLGGLGYIAGIAGLALWLNARRSRPDS